MNSCGGRAWQLPVTFLVRADELCVGQHSALYCSLDLGLLSRFLDRACYPAHKAY